MSVGVIVAIVIVVVVVVVVANVCYCWKKTKHNIAVCCWFVICFVVNGIAVCLL